MMIEISKEEIYNSKIQDLKGKDMNKIKINRLLINEKYFKNISLKNFYQTFNSNHTVNILKTVEKKTNNMSRIQLISNTKDIIFKKIENIISLKRLIKKGTKTSNLKLKILLSNKKLLKNNIGSIDLKKYLKELSLLIITKIGTENIKNRIIPLKTPLTIIDIREAVS